MPAGVSGAAHAARCQLPSIREKPGDGDRSDDSGDAENTTASKPGDSRDGASSTCSSQDVADAPRKGLGIFQPLSTDESDKVSSPRSPLDTVGGTLKRSLKQGYAEKADLTHSPKGNDFTSPKAEQGRQRFCTSCGKKVIKPSARFCVWCSAPLLFQGKTVDDDRSEASDSRPDDDNNILTVAIGLLDMMGSMSYHQADQLDVEHASWCAVKAQ